MERRGEMKMINIYSIVRHIGSSCEKAIMLKIRKE